MFSREDVQRQVAVVAVVAVKEPSFLVAMDRIVGGIQVQNDLRGLRFVGRDKRVDHPPVDLVAIHGDLLVPLLAIDLLCGQFQPVQRALACQRLSPVSGLPPVFSQWIGLLHRHGQHRIGP